MKIYSPNITGSLLVTGSNNTITGSLTVTQGVTGSLFGTASWADNATSASFASTSSFTTAVSGTTNYVSKFTGTNTLGDSQIFDTGTNIGINTNAPQDRIHLLGGYMRYQFASGFPDIYGRIGHNGNSGGFEIISQYQDTNTASGNIRFITGLTGSTSERMRITHNGNIGIGTTTPTFTLDVTGSAGATARFRGSGQSTVSLNDGTNENYIVGVSGQLRFAPSNSTAMTMLSGGNVGIGTTTPGDRLQVVGGGVTAQSINAIGPPSVFTGTGGIIMSYASDVGTIRAYSNSNGTGTAAINFLTSGSERVRITGVGNVGIGTNAPAAPLDVRVSNNGLNFNVVARNTDATQTGGNAVGYAFINEGALSATFYKAGIVHERLLSFGRGTMHFLLNNTGDGSQTTLSDSRMSITSAGNVGIGTTNPQVALHAVSTVASGTGFIFATTSNTGGTGAGIDFQYDSGTSALRRIARILPNVQSGGGGDLLFQTAPSATGTYDTKLTILRNGDIGIGTTSPTEKLDVNGSIKTTGEVKVPQAGIITFGTTWNTGTLSFNNGPTTALVIDVPNNRVRNNLGSYLTSATNIGRFGTFDNFATTFVTNNTERVRIISTGEVGIGTTIPESNVPLTVNTNNNSFNSTLVLQNSNTGTGALSQIQMRTQNTLATPLNIQQFGSDGTGQIINQATSSLQLGTSGSVRLTINSTGNVGIGTTTPTQRLHVAGNTLISNNLTLGSNAGPTNVSRGYVNFDVPSSGSSQGGSLYAEFKSETDGDGFGVASLYMNPEDLIEISHQDVQSPFASSYLKVSKNEIGLINSNGNGIGVGIYNPEAYVHINSNPGEGKYLRIDATMVSSEPAPYTPVGGSNNVGNIIGNIVDDNVLGTPDYWMEIELNINGNIVLIPCYTPR